jgi:hypothetical protein
VDQLYGDAGMDWLLAGPNDEISSGETVEAT